MAVTYEPIASQTLGADTSTVTFSNIPDKFSDLVLVAVARTTASATSSILAIRVNSDQGANYSSTNLQGTGSSVTSGRNSSDTYLRLAAYGVAGASAAASTYGTSLIQFLSYANTNVFKTALMSGAIASGGVMRGVGLWRSTAAISSLSCVGITVNFVSGSTFSLYGIKAA